MSWGVTAVWVNIPSKVSVLALLNLQAMQKDSVKAEAGLGHAVSSPDMLAISNDCLSVDMWSCTYSTVVLFFLPCLRRACMETVHSPIYT